jgi:hypothetical protein
MVVDAPDEEPGKGGKSRELTILWKSEIRAAKWPS